MCVPTIRGVREITNRCRSEISKELRMKAREIVQCVARLSQDLFNKVYNIG